MRVLHVIESLEFGGAEKVVIDLANAMAHHHQVFICCVKTLGELRSAVNASIPVFCLQKGEGNDWRIPLKFREIIREYDIEVVHSHNWGVFLEAAISAILSPNVILVNTVHGPYMDYPPGLISQLKRRLRHVLEKAVSWRHRRVVLVSDAIAAYVVHEIGIVGSRITTVHNGIAGSDTLPQQRSAESLRFITVGRLAAIKNQALMIRAFCEAGCADSELWIAGDGPERANLESLTQELGMSNRVRFLGFCHDVTPYLTQCDVFVMSSNYEGISIAVLEAMRAGLPVIGTAVGGMHETVENGVTGELVPAADISALAAAMRKLGRSRDDRIRLGAAGRAKMLAGFSIENMVRRYLEIYAIPPTA